VPSTPPRTTEITLAGMRFHVCVGILPHEREIAQPLEVDLRVRLPADRSSVLDYRTLHALVTAAVARDPLEYLEALARAVLDAALALEGVAWARVAVRKPHVALGGPLTHVEIAIEGARG
jgi:FolB domain-containing protein